MTEKPYLLIDVDGPLNPWAASNRKVPDGFRSWRIDGYKVRLARWHGEELKKLMDVYDLVWATTWEHQANTDIGPRIGLPELPVVEFRKLGEKHPEPEGSKLYFKTRIINAYAYGRPFVWVDDEVGALDGVHLAQWHNAPFLLLKIDPATGLTAEHFQELREWAENEAQ